MKIHVCKKMFTAKVYAKAYLLSYMKFLQNYLF